MSSGPECHTLTLDRPVKSLTVSTLSDSLDVSRKLVPIDCLHSDFA